MLIDPRRSSTPDRAATARPRGKLAVRHGEVSARPANGGRAACRRARCRRVTHNGSQVRKFDAIVIALIAGATLLFAGSVLHVGRTDALVRYRAGESLRVGYALEEPFATRDAAGRVTGVAPEVLRRILPSVGSGRTTWVHGDFGSLIHELRTGRIDVIASGLEITDERRELVAFSRPTMRVRTGLLVDSGNPLRLDSLAAVARQERARLAVLSGSVEARMASRAGVPESRILSFPDALTAFAAMVSGRADAIALSTLSLRALASKGSAHSLAVVRLPDEESRWRTGEIAFAFRHEDRALREAVDAALDDFLGTAAHRALAESFGVPGDQLPPHPGR